MRSDLVKVYVNDEDYKQYLDQHLRKEITRTNNIKEAHYIITGTLKGHEITEHLKGVIIPFTGHNGIDIKALKSHDVQLYNTTIHSRYVAEKALALTLALLGHVVYYHKKLEQGNWSKRTTPERLPWVTLQHKTVGIYGYGRIGRFLHDYLKPFNVDVYVIDRGKDYGSAKTVKNLTNLVQVSDVIIIAAPLSKETEGVFNQAILEQMVDKFLVNVGRGKIIDEYDLYQALKNKTLRGFASDVWYTYPKSEDVVYPSKYPIHEFEEVVMTPHSGGHTEQSKTEMMAYVTETLHQIYEGDTSRSLDLNTLK